MDHGIRHQPDACRAHWFGCFEMENTCYSAHGFKPLCGIANGGNRSWGDSSDFSYITARTAIGQPLHRSKIPPTGLNGRSEVRRVGKESDSPRTARWQTLQQTKPTPQHPNTH